MVFSIVTAPSHVPTSSAPLLNPVVGAEKGREVRGWKMPELKSHPYIFGFFWPGQMFKINSLGGCSYGLFPCKTFIQMMSSPGSPIRELFSPGLLTWGPSTWIE